MMVNSPNRSTSESVGGQAQADAGAPGGQHDADDPGDPEAGPHHEPWGGREQGAGQDHRH
jgi:hypothetical protein